MPNPICRRRSLGSGLEPVPPPQFRTFDGVNDDLQSASVIDLSGVATVSVAFWLWVNTSANDDHIALEHSNDFNANTGFVVNPNNSFSTAGTAGLGVNGNVGKNQSLYTRPTVAVWNHWAAVFDFSQPSPETTLYINGVLQTAGSTPLSSNNTGNFASKTLNVMSRGNASLFLAGRMARLALWPGVVLSQNDVLSLYSGRLATKVQPAANPYYWPLNGVASPEPALDARGIAMTVNG